MSLMAINRRHFLLGSALGLTEALWSRAASPAFAQHQDRLLITACRRADGGFAFVVLTPGGDIVRTIPIQGRGHDVALHSATGGIVAFARRPGRFAVSFNLKSAANPILFAPPVDRHFYGHGTFSHDGRLLYASENDFDNARGVIGIYDATAKFSRLGEFESFGVGPHDMVLLGDGKTLVVANGGIETHPESGRTKLNLSTMAPSLCFVDVTNGDLIARHTLAKEHRLLSLRHLTASADGEVWFGGQWQGEGQSSPVLVGSVQQDQPVRLLEGAETPSSSLRGYIGSVALSSDGRWLAASAPRASKIMYFDTQKPGVWRQTTIKDASGVAPTGNGEFVVSSGTGQWYNSAFQAGVEANKTVGGIAFDNHLQIYNPGG